MTNVYPLAVYRSVLRQHVNKPYAYGKGFPVYERLGFIPTFQISRFVNVGAAFTVKIVNLSDDTETDITADVLATGGSIIPISDTEDVISFASTLQIATAFSSGTYYLKITDGQNSWVTDWFRWLDSTLGYIKIEYFHFRNIQHSGGQIAYVAPFRCRMYWRALIGKPRRRYEETVKKRLGRNFPIQQTTWKEYRFEVLLNEEMVDAMALIRLHDVVTITDQDQVYDVDEFFFPDPAWPQNGAVVVVGMGFRADTVVVENARGIAGQEYTPGVCVTAEHICVGLTVDGSEEHTNFQYTDSSGAVVDLADADKVLVRETNGSLRVYQYAESPQGYTLLPTPAQTAVFVQSNANYYSGVGSDTVVLPGVFFYDQNLQTVAGTFMPGATHYLYSVVGLNAELIGGYTYQELAIDGVAIPLPEVTEFIRMEIASGACGVFYTAEDYEVQQQVGGQGIGSDIIGSTLKVY